MSEPDPHTPFRPVDRDSFPGHPMPASVPPGLRLELSRARVKTGKEAAFDEWMAMLHDRYDECLDTLSSERAAFEATFKHTEADGSMWMYHLTLIGVSGSGLDLSNPVDAAHEAFAREVKEPGWEELTPTFMIAPRHILEEMQTFGEIGQSNDDPT